MTRARPWARGSRASSPGIWALVALLVVVSGAVLWWSRLPRLVVHVDPALDFEVEWPAFRQAFHEAGVQRLELVMMDSGQGVGNLRLGPAGRSMEVALVSRPGRNSRLDAGARAAGKTDSGSTEGRVAVVYPDEIARFLGRHRAAWTQAEVTDWPAVRTHLFTNTAVREVWCAVTDSHSRNPVDGDSVMFADPARAAVSFGTRYLPFTRSHRSRLESMFAPLLPGSGDPFERG